MTNSFVKMLTKNANFMKTMLIIVGFFYRWSTEFYTLTGKFWRNFIIGYLLEEF